MTAGRTVTGQRQDWNTPQRYVAAVERMFGHVDLDPCWNEDSLVDAAVRYQLPEHDGLTSPWLSERIYVNPPYGRDPERGTTIKDWLQRCADAARCGSEVVALIPVATNTSHWKEHIFGVASAVCFLAEPRLRFRINGTEKNKGCPMAICFVYWGDRADDFEAIFGRYGTVVRLTRTPHVEGAAA
jgi:hypothetical protein